MLTVNNIVEINGIVDKFLAGKIEEETFIEEVLAVIPSLEGYSLQYLIGFARGASMAYHATVGEMIELVKD